MTDDMLRQEHREYLQTPWEWRGFIRRTDLPKWVKYVLLAAADRANRDGTSIKVGVSLLAIESETTYNRTQEALRIARRSGLLFRAYEGNRRKQLPAEWWLIMHPTVMDHVRVESPDQQKRRAESMRVDKQESWSKSKTADGSSTPVDESCTPEECMNEDDDTGIMHPTGVHDPKTSCTREECTKPGSCTREGSETDRSCTRGGCTTSKEQGDLNRATPTPSDEIDLRTAAHPPREAEPSAEDLDSAEVVDIATRRCRHGRSPRSDRGVPRCPDCRLEAETAPAPEPTPAVKTPAPVKVRPPHCVEHPAMKGGNRPDGQPHCTFCRQKARTG